MSDCHDCSTCTGRSEFNRGLGRTTREVARLAARCSTCGHRLSRHLHGALRLPGSDPTGQPDIHLSVDPPPRDSPLGRLLVELGQYDDYFEHLR